MQTAAPRRDSIYIFIAAFLAAGIISYIDPVPDLFFSSLLFCAETTIYAGMIIFWMQSIYRRLLPSRTRASILSAAAMMLFLLVIRAVKYRIAAGHVVMERYCWYLYYVPLIMIPALFAAACYFIDRETGRRAKSILRLLLLSAPVFVAGILTNDLHHLSFAPAAGKTLTGGVDGTYTYGILFYLTYVHMAAGIVAGIFFLRQSVRRLRDRRRAALPFILFFIMITAMTAVHILRSHDIDVPYMMPEIGVFSFLAIFESCIRSRLIPYNDKYQMLFNDMTLPAMITDEQFIPVYRSGAEISADREQLKRACTEPVLLTPQSRLSGKEIRAGYAFWTEDLREIRAIYERQMEVNEILEGENALIQAENELRERRAHIESRNRIYSEIAEKLRPVQIRISQLLDETDPSEPEFRSRIAEISLLNAYVKRKANLLLISSEKEQIESHELALALEETAGYLHYCGCSASVARGEEVMLPGNFAVLLYDCFEKAVEILLPEISYLMISLAGREIRLTADAEETLDDRLFQLPVRSVLSDGLLYLTISGNVRPERM